MRGHSAQGQVPWPFVCNNTIAYSGQKNARQHIVTNVLFSVLEEAIGGAWQ